MAMHARYSRSFDRSLIVGWRIKRRKWRFQMAKSDREFKSDAAQILGLAHVGIRVHDLARSRQFYELFGFKLVWGPFGPDRITALKHPSGLEINLIVNAPEPKSPNILMDVLEKHAGFTHVALKIGDVVTTEAALKAVGVPISWRRGKDALFIRDPDGNVVELAAD
jgi:lactoylglutathione lyase